MKLTHHAVNGVDVLALNGRFDSSHVAPFATWFDEHPQAQRVVVSLAGVSFIDSSGLSTLVRGLKHCRSNKGDLVLCSLQEAVAMIVELTRLDKAFAIYQDEATAIRAQSG